MHINRFILPLIVIALSSGCASSVDCRVRPEDNIGYSLADVQTDFSLYQYYPLF